MDILADVFELDSISDVSKSITQQTTEKIICQVMWGNEPIGQINQHIRLMFQSYVDAMRQSNLKVLGHLARFISVIVETVFSERRGHSEKFDLFAMELGQYIKSSPDVTVLELSLAYLQPSWLTQRVCQTLLDRYDTSLVSNLEQPSGASLTAVISWYFYLMPMFKQAIVTPHKKNKVRPPIQPAPRKKPSDINRRNSKGESRLHHACIKNNPSRLKELLAVPGIDVNVADNFGWTPLHEACNHGHIECVKLLLAYQPTSCMASYLNTTMRLCDTMSRNVEGVTPLYDAVANNQVPFIVVTRYHSLLFLVIMCLLLITDIIFLHLFKDHCICTPTTPTQHNYHRVYTGVV